MAKDTGRAESAIVDADKSAVITDESVGNVDPERKEKYLKRVKAEDEANKINYETVEEWIEVVGQKVLVKHKSRAGSVYSTYWFNAKKFPLPFSEMKKNAGAKFGHFETGKTRFIKLKYVDGRPFIKKDK